MSRKTKETKRRHHITTSCVSKKITDRIFTLTKLNRDGEIFQQFERVMDDEQELDFLACNRCYQAYVYKGHKTGTSTLKRHVCAGDKPKRELKSLPNMLEKHEILNSCAQMVTTDIRPYNIVNGEGMQSLIQKCMDVQRNHVQRVHVKDLLPDRTTVSKHVQVLAGKERNLLKQTLHELLDKKMIHFTCDMWTESYRNVPFLTVTCHYIDATWTLQSRVLFTKEFDVSLPKTGINIFKAVLEGFKDFNVDEEELEGSIWTTDRGANIVKALRSLERVDCVAHVLQTCLRHTFKDGPHEVVQTITQCKSLVTYVKRKSWCTKLPTSLKQSCETRWNSTYTMLLSVQTNMEPLVELLQQHDAGEMQRVTCIDVPLLAALTSFLKPFYTATNDLEGDVHSSICYVLPIIGSLERHCANDVDECVAICALKTKCGQVIKEKFKRTMHHQLAMFLHPGFQELNGLEEEVVESTKQHVIDYIESSMLLPPEPKTMKMDARFTCYANRVAEPCRDEYDRYLSTAVADSDPLIF